MRLDPVSMKAQLRYTTQKLGQLQAKNDSQATITRTDIATLLRGGNIALAREKAERLIQDEAFGDVLEVVEMHTGILLERFHELESGLFPGPMVIEATSTIVFAAPHINSKELEDVCTFLIECLGPDFTLSVVSNHKRHISQRVLQALARLVPSAYQLDYALFEIAKSFGVSWTPEIPRDALVNPLSEILDPEGSPIVDLERLRTLCKRGIPDEPCCLRPRIWKLLFGIVPCDKSIWKSELLKQRSSYYNLVDRVLEPFSQRDVPSHLDERLRNSFNQLAGLPADMLSLLEDEPEFMFQSPLYADAPAGIRVPHAHALDQRMNLLQGSVTRESSPLPEIRLEAGAEEVGAPGSTVPTFTSSMPNPMTRSTTLIPARKRIFGHAHPIHCSSMLRILYVHTTLNPGTLSAHTASLLIPLYSAMNREVDADDLAHAEADTFWLLEAMLAEFAGLEDEGGMFWLKKFSECLAWADYNFSTDLEARGLDPSLPHYSYRWLGPVLTHTLSLPDVFLVWDALFSRSGVNKSSNPKLAYLVDICVSLLVRGKSHLIRLGKSTQASRSLWTGDWEMTNQDSYSQESFVACLLFLQKYDLRLVGGVERVLQTAADLSDRRQQEQASSQPVIGRGLGLWMRNGGEQVQDSNPGSKGFLREAFTAAPSSIASRVTNTVWRGITNQSAMEDEPPSPLPLDETPQPPQVPTTHVSSVWDYAEKLRSSDAMASISKASTKWRPSGLLETWNSGKSVVASASSPPTIMSPDRTQALPHDSSVIRQNAESDAAALSPKSSGGLVEMTKSMFSMRSPPAMNTTPRSAPRPLLLTSSFSSSPLPLGEHSRTSSLTPDTNDWAEVMKLKRQHFHRDSQSSVSSLSPSDAFSRVPKSSRSDWESDATSSRIVSLNRRSISPMAPNFRVPHVRPSSRTSSASSDLHSPPFAVKSPLTRGSILESPLVLGLSQDVSKKPTLADSEGSETSNENHSLNKTPPKTLTATLPSDPVQLSNRDHSGPTRTNRVRSKRYRPANLQINDNSRPLLSTEQEVIPAPNLTVGWPAEDHDSIMTPRALNFDSDEHDTTMNSSLPRSTASRRIRKGSTGPEQLKKPPIDHTIDERPRKISSSRRLRKTSTENRDVTKSRRESAAVEGDDEGYDDLLSAYESEDHQESSRA